MTAPDDEDVVEAYATSEQLQTYWKLLSEGDKARADDLLKRVAVLINELPGALTEDGELAFSAQACEHVSLDAVKRAMVSRGDGVIEHTAGMADMTGTDRYVNPVGNLYLQPAEKARLIATLNTASTAQGFSLIPTSNVRVPGEPWNCQPSSQS